MRISDWSSDVCSSDLNAVAHRTGRLPPRPEAGVRRRQKRLAHPSRKSREGRGDARLTFKQGESYGLESVDPAVSPLGIDYLHRYRASHCRDARLGASRSDEHTSDLQSLMRISYAVFCWK